MRFFVKGSSFSQKSLWEGVWVHILPLGATDSTRQNQGTTKGRESDWDWQCVLGNPLSLQTNILPKKDKEKHPKMELRGFKDSTETSWAWGSGYHSGNLRVLCPQKEGSADQQHPPSLSIGPNVLKCK